MDMKDPSKWQHISHLWSAGSCGPLDCLEKDFLLLTSGLKVSVLSCVIMWHMSCYYKGKNMSFSTFRPPVEILQSVSADQPLCQTESFFSPNF